MFSVSHRLIFTLFYLTCIALYVFCHCTWRRTVNSVVMVKRTQKVHSCFLAPCFFMMSNVISPAVNLIWPSVLTLFPVSFALFPVKTGICQSACLHDAFQKSNLIEFLPEISICLTVGQYYIALHWIFTSVKSCLISQRITASCEQLTNFERVTVCLSTCIHKKGKMSWLFFRSSCFMPVIWHVQITF